MRCAIASGIAPALAGDLGPWLWYCLGLMVTVDGKVTDMSTRATRDRTAAVAAETAAGRKRAGQPSGGISAFSAASGSQPGSVMAIGEQPPLDYPASLKAEAGCAVVTARLLWQRRLHLPAERVGLRLGFGDQTSALVYRETAVDHGPVRDPCVLIVGFRLRGVRGRGHAVFRWESLLNTPLFAGFPGLVSKLWLASDERGRYRGLYEWDGPEQARDYARALWRVLALVCVPGSIHYVVLPGLRRDELLGRLEILAGAPEAEMAGAAAGWWRPVAVS